MPIKRWLDFFLIVVYPYNGILLSNRKEWTTDTHSNMDESQNNYADWKKSDKKEHTVVHDFIYIKL